MNTCILLWWLAQAGANAAQGSLPQVIHDIARSGRVLQIAEDRARLEHPQRLIAPGAPPLLSFRYFEGVDRHRYGKLDLMLDDAGH